MFDIVASTDIMIKEFGVHVNYVGILELAIYSTCCNQVSYAGVKRHPTGWMLAGQTDVVGKGSGVATALTAGTFDPICITSSFGSKGFYLTATEGQYIVQTPGGEGYATGQVYKSNEDISVLVGIGKRYYLLQDQDNMIFNGNIRYSIFESDRAGDGGIGSKVSSSDVTVVDNTYYALLIFGCTLSLLTMTTV